ncbi:SEC14 family lipid-binding protein [Aspergillus saccharolyticus JOP 1030-1]|uniref:CRAL/TRIO domain-containing protein n=1 Tax=Aspergillus saccharolyticus JOP 1030-1 TaxID=1450539 RepID=A0A318ZMF4_9EURO|nr:CRAL/TRIO domain-containing protein [Aspergillus saccharolyticus JOP 1030-1]PYH48769.1 CRAL/TRIO domain-containing protein [Aspergillus saccharolyticus JOP 1030-1]
MPFWGSKSTPTKAETEASSTHDATDSKNDPVAAAEQAAGTGWLAGHLHHLTEDQEQKLEEFKKLCEQNGYYRPERDGEKASHGDATMLRFLRARKFDIDGAWGQFKDTEDWRRENAIESLYENIDVEAYEAARRMYPQWTGRRDRRGIPVYVFEIQHLNNKNMAAYKSTLSAETQQSSKVPERLLRLFALYENLLRFVMPLCSQLSRPNPETPITSSNNIVDVSGVGLKQFWDLKGHMQDASVLATAHYPETLDRIFIIGAPSFFPTVWGWIKRWFDPVTTSKIFILSAAEVKPTLTTFMEPSSIPKQYGGDLDWKWGDMPNFDEEARQVIGALETPPAEGETKPTFIKGPVLFNGDNIEILGKVNGESRKSTIPAGSTAQQGEPASAPVQEAPAQEPSEVPAENEKVAALQEEAAAPKPEGETATNTVAA